MMFVKEEIATIISRKFDGAINHQWKAKFIRKTDSLLEFVGEFEKEINHSHLGVIRPKTNSFEYFWTDRWYNIFRFHEPDGSFRNFYCNINMPPIFDNNVLNYVDLDVDIVVWRDFSYEILDSDEFEQNAGKYLYSQDTRSKVKTALDELISMIENREFPFDYKL